MKSIVTAISILCIATVSFGQVGNRSMWTNYEQEQFFYHSTWLNPLNVGSFQQTPAGLISDPLNDLALNPARFKLPDGNDHYLYANYHARQELREPPQPIFLVDASNNYVGPYPYMGSYGSSKVMQPLFSLAYLGTPFPNKKWSVGVTYRALYFNDNFYTIPNSDYYGSDALAMDNVSVPDLKDAFDQNTMKQSGHFINLYSNYDFTDRLSVGIKISKVFFNRNGSWNSLYTGTYYPPYYDTFLPNPNALNDGLQTRSQGYDHWDLELGSRFKLNRHIQLGMHAGWLKGDGQQINQQNGNNQSSISDPPDNEWENRLNVQNNQVYKNDGHTWYGGLNLDLESNDHSRLTLTYNLEYENAGLNMNSNIYRNRYSNYQYLTNGEMQRSINDFSLKELRGGNGQQERWSHQGAAWIHLNADPNVSLNTGIALNYSNFNVLTAERVNYQRHQTNRTIDANGNEEKSYYNREEDKTVNWNYALQSTSIQIPLVANVTITRYLTVNVGFNHYTNWLSKNEQTTTHYNSQLVTSSDQGDESKSDFDEIYNPTSQSHRRFSNALLTGFSVSPIDKVALNLWALPILDRKNYDQNLHGLSWNASVEVRF